MRTRAIGSAFVVAVGILPTVAGGLAFAVLMLALGLIGFQEYAALTNLASSSRTNTLLPVAAMLLIVLAIAAGTGANASILAVILFLGTILPLVSVLPRVGDADALAHWALASTGLTYIGIPVYSAIVLRSLPGATDPSWLDAVAQTVSRSSFETSRGLAWTLLTILVIWIGDSTAYLIGRSVGRHKLAPRISPGKTVEGAFGGLLGSALMATLAFTHFGLGPMWIGTLVGVVIGGMGQLGDLCESFIKRQAGQKDSGNIIPGHGGMLDRIDALLFAFPTALLLASSLEWLGIY